MGDQLHEIAARVGANIGCVGVPTLCARLGRPACAAAREGTWAAAPGGEQGRRGEL